MSAPDVTLRPLRPSDHATVITVIDDWWGGRQMAGMLPRLFFEHFTDTCFAAERDGELAGFLVGFLSQSRPAEAYIHFVGVHPGAQGRPGPAALPGVLRSGSRARPDRGARGDRAGEHRLGRVPPPGGVLGRAGAGGAAGRT